MKIRADYVTNSSSSSFILARKEEISEKQKEVIVDFVLSELLGEKFLSPEASEQDIQDFFEEYVYEEEQQEAVLQALKNGKSIFCGWVNFEENDGYAYMLQELWDKLEKSNTDTDNFDIIDGDLRY